MHVVVCRSEDDSLRFIQKVTAWSFKREFRLYAADCTTRREDYFGVLFSILPVERQRHILLEDLMDRRLLSHSLVGMGLELQAPFTVFAANVFECDDEDKKREKPSPASGRSRKKELVYWSPIEAEEPSVNAKELRVVPPRFCGFCRVCRETVTQALIAEFKARGPSPQNCQHKPIQLGMGQTCAGVEAACLKQDWNHCPAFLQLRAEKCPCYQSDLRMIRAFEGKWLGGEPVEDKTVLTCWAGLTEVGLPIIVHNHLVGVAMTGQFVLESSNLPEIKELLGRCTLLKPVHVELERFRRILLGAEPDPNKGEEVHTRQFRITQERLERKIGILHQGVEQIIKVAKTHYQWIRGRSESVFEQELLGRIENVAGEHDFFRGPVLEGLARMREFWAFRAAYLLVLPRDSRDLSVLALSTENHSKSFGFPGRSMGHVPPGYRADRPLPMLLDYADELRMCRTPAKDFKAFLEHVWHNPDWDIPQRARCYFVAMAPVAGNLFAFLFADRDQSAVSLLGRPAPRGVSELAQDIIFETCTDVVHKLGDIWYQRERAWREFSAMTSHRIGNQIHAAGTLVDLLADELRSDPRWAKQWVENLTVIQGCIRESKRMLTSQAMLTAQLKPVLQSSDLEDLVRRATRGVLRPTDGLLVSIESTCRSLSVDASLMEEVFRELAVNSVRASDKPLLVQVRAFPGATAREATTVKHTQHVVIMFSDNGPGVPDHIVSRIFDPFVSGRSDQTGLGLFVVRRIIEAHDGSIELATIGQGATFLIRLPRNGGIRLP
jgi:signal transduction histidine kinase